VLILLKSILLDIASLILYSSFARVVTPASVKLYPEKYGVCTDRCDGGGNAATGFVCVISGGTIEKVGAAAPVGVVPAAQFC
jgi:hypothetical protein